MRQELNDRARHITEKKDVSRAARRIAKTRRDNKGERQALPTDGQVESSLELLGLPDFNELAGGDEPVDKTPSNRAWYEQKGPVYFSTESNIDAPVAYNVDDMKTLDFDNINQGYAPENQQPTHYQPPQSPLPPAPPQPPLPPAPPQPPQYPPEQYSHYQPPPALGYPPGVAPQYPEPVPLNYDPNSQSYYNPPAVQEYPPQSQYDVARASYQQPYDSNVNYNQPPEQQPTMGPPELDNNGDFRVLLENILHLSTKSPEDQRYDNFEEAWHKYANEFKKYRGDVDRMKRPNVGYPRDGPCDPVYSFCDQKKKAYYSTDFRTKSEKQSALKKILGKDYASFIDSNKWFIKNTAKNLADAFVRGIQVFTGKRPFYQQNRR